VYDPGGEPEVTTSVATVTQDFRFIDLSVTSTEEKRQNRKIARSHAMKVVRGSQRRLRQSVKRMSSGPPMVSEEEEDGKVEGRIETLPSSSVSETLDWQSIYSAGFAATMAKGFNSKIISPTHRVMLECDIGPLQTYSGKPTPALHECIEHCKSSL
jgi:hypothetical protein